MKRVLALAIISLVLDLAQSADTEENIYQGENLAYYIETKQKFTWSEALNECNRRQMALATVDTEEKATALQKVLKEAFLDKNMKIPRLYIGAHDMDKFRKFIWISTGQPLTFTNWEKTEPNNYQKLNERCVHLGFHGNDQWNDIKCSRKYGFICEQSKTDYEFAQLSRSMTFA